MPGGGMWILGFQAVFSAQAQLRVGFLVCSFLAPPPRPLLELRGSCLAPALGSEGRGLVKLHSLQTRLPGTVRHAEAPS